MSKRYPVLIATFFIIASLVLASCTSTSTQTTTTTTSATTSTKEVPKYGETVKLCINSDPSTLDEGDRLLPATAYTLFQTNEELCTGDWTKGLAGTGEVEWTINAISKMSYYSGAIAESWEIPELGHIIYHIRQGNHYALNPNSEASKLVNGREVTAFDVEKVLNRYINNPACMVGMDLTRFATVTAPDKWTVDIIMPPETFCSVVMFCDYASIYPPEVVEKYGNMLDWHNSVGSGPFILTDYAIGSSITLERNPTYWRTDPIGPGKGNQLPYLDGVKFMIIPDTSTKIAALRTNKIDILTYVNWEDSNELKVTNKDLLAKEAWSGASGAGIAMRLDKTGYPFNDIRVRRALMMAIDFEEINNTWAGGIGQINSWPVYDMKEYHDAYLSLEEAPASVQELYSHNPDKAKALLAEAGYADGFDPTVTCPSTPEVVDYLSIIKGMWAEVGVNMIIDAREPTAFTGVQFNRAYDEMMGTAGAFPIGALYIAASYSGVSFSNQSYINDPTVTEAMLEIGKVAIMDPPEADRLHKELMKYVLDQVWKIPPILTPTYNTWWPWVKNYHGEVSVGTDSSFNFTKYIWIDQDLKKSMGH